MLTNLHRIAIAIASVALLLMALLGGTDVVSGVVLGKPIPAVYEATELLMVIATALAMGPVQQRRMNIAVDVISSRLSLTWQKAILLLSNLIGICLFGLIAWQGWLIAWESVRTLEYAQGAVRIPVYPSKIAFAIGISLLALQYLIDVLHWKETDPAPASDAALVPK